MLRVYACLTGQHDLRLIFLAVLICIAACSTSVKLFIHANTEKDQALSWLFGAAAVFGGGAWATQIITEFAYEPGLPTSYNAGLTLVSLLAAIAIAWLGMFVAHRYAALALGGGMIGAGIAAMHYIGMAALRAAAHQHLDLFYVLASVAVGMIAATAAMRVLSREPAARGRFAAVVLLVLAIVGLHFTGVTALALVPDPLMAVPGHAIAPIILILAISTVVVVIAGFCSLGALDAYLALRTAREAERLRHSEDHLARAEKTAHIGSIVQDLQTGAITWSGETHRLFGLDPNLPAPVGEALLALIHPDDRAAWVTTQWLGHQAASAGTLREMPGVSLRFRIVQAGGAVKQVHHESELVLDQRGAPVRWVGTYRDVTEAYEAEESLKLAFEENPGPMWLFDTETLKFLGVNKAAIAHYGYDRDSFLKLTLLDVVPQCDREAIKQAIRTNPAASGSPSYVWQHVKAEGTEIDVLTYFRNLTFCGRPAQLVAIMDVTAKHQAEARIAHMAHHDALTDLPNRVLFHERLDEALLRVRRYNETLAVLYLDLDRFKNVNDTLGHAAGDKLLVEVAERLRACVRDCDLAARLGGDEFAVLQLGLAGPHEAGALAERIVTLLSEPYDVDGQLVEIGASTGIALAPADGETADQLLRNADMALFRAKNEGRRTSAFSNLAWG